MSVPTTDNDSNAVDFLNLYNQVINAVHAVIIAYYNFGRNLKKRLEYHTEVFYFFDAITHSC